MLSILIPVYNYNSFPLVYELTKQAKLCGIEFEILCFDDYPASTNTPNENINQLLHCSYKINSKTLGRAQNRNHLADQAKFDWLLFLDCDMMPSHSGFIKNYITEISKGNCSAIYGGLAYQNIGTNKNKLRYNYGLRREVYSLQKRKKNPFQYTLTSNFLIPKKTFNTIRFNNSLTLYGYEDLVFINELKNSGQTICHINNPSYHLNIENSAQFISKCLKAMESLQFIEQNKLIPNNHTKIQKAYICLDKLHLTSFFAYIYKSSKPLFEAHLQSINASLRILDIFKLSYFCYLKSK